MKLLLENWREYLNEEDNSYYNRCILAGRSENDIREGITYSEYQRVMKPLLEDSDYVFSTMVI